MEQLDYRTRMKITDAITRSNNTGRDTAEYLHSYGLLATPQWRATVRGDAVRDVAELISKMSLADIVKIHQVGAWTASEIFHGLAEKLKQVEKEAREGQW